MGCGKTSVRVAASLLTFPHYYFATIITTLIIYCCSCLLYITILVVTVHVCLFAFCLSVCQPNWSRQMATDPELGSARRFCSLATVATVAHKE